jgi:alkanesulfonate monooxygenase SsuD/methylene tetrahydromethanopterin reductase-like flavin-dependent oxidoreductase (luciferase family)
MVRNGINGFMGGGAAVGGARHGLIEAWRDRLARAGRETELGGNLIIGFSAYITDSEAEAIKRVQPFVEEHQKMFGPLGFAGPLTDEQVEMLADPKRARQAGLPTVQDQFDAGSWFCGTAEQVAEKLLALQEKYPGLEEVMVGQPVGTPRAVILEQLERFGTEVMPLLRRG